MEIGEKKLEGQRVEGGVYRAKDNCMQISNVRTGHY